MREHLCIRHDYRKLNFGMDDDEPMTKLDSQHYLNYAGTVLLVQVSRRTKMKVLTRHRGVYSNVSPYWI